MLVVMLLKLVSLKKLKSGSFWDGFREMTQAALVIASIGDKTDPAGGCETMYQRLPTLDKQYVLLARKNGHAQDYDHVGMVVSKDAQAEVWPLILEWTDKRFPAGAKAINKTKIKATTSVS